jgi:hypothetical protein
MADILAQIQYGNGNLFNVKTSAFLIPTKDQWKLS